MAKLSEEASKNLHSQLVKLGDMMGDGLHLESDGKWISAEYKRTLRALGMLPKKNNDTLNARMCLRIEQEKCGKCGQALKQTRGEAKIAICVGCGTKWRLLK